LASARISGARGLSAMDQQGEGTTMSDQGSERASSGDADRPPYEVPSLDESVRVFDGTRWGKTVPAVYLGFERVADDFFMHRVRSESGVESSIASYNVYRCCVRADGDRWESLTPKPRVR
jgi:hypothetical protein